MAIMSFSKQYRNYGKAGRDYPLANFYLFIGKKEDCYVQIRSCCMEVEYATEG